MNSSPYRPCVDAKVECIRIGNEAEPLVKIDGFMTNADHLKAFAIERNQFTPASTFYPGIRMPAPDHYATALVKILAGLIENLFGLEPRKLTGAHALYSIVTRAPDELSLLQKIPHFDAPSRKSLAAIHYLAEDPNSGTALYRHRQSGFEYIDQTRMNPYFQQVERQLKHKAPKGYICGSTEEYEQIASFSAEYNRLLLYRGSSLHSGIIPPDHDFDPNPATGRLTVTSFLDFA